MNEESSEAELVSVSPSAIESIERASIDVQIATARKYPRVISAVRKEMLSMATLDEETAASCFFNLPRGGKSINGPSIRMAEIAISCFGNVRVATRIIGAHLGEDPHVIIQAVCHDLEKNSAVCIEKRGRITGKKKNGGKPDDDDINLATNRTTAFALRDAVFKIVPGVLVKPVFEAAKRVAIGDASTLSDRRAKAVEAFAKMGVTPDRLCAALEIKSVDDINLEHLEKLTGLRTAIKDGQTTIDEAFPLPQKTENKGLFGKDAAAAATTPPADPPKETAKEPAKKEKTATKSPAPDAVTASPLASDKTLLADWMNRNKLDWSKLQPILVKLGNAFPFADSTGSFDELTAAQAKTIFDLRSDLEAELDNLPI